MPNTVDLPHRHFSAPMWLLALALLTAELMGGCSGRSVVRLAPPAPLKDAWGIAVYPVTFRSNSSPYESFVRGREIADQLSHETNCLVFGPGEFRVIDVDDDDPRHGSTVGSSVRYSPGHTMGGLYVLRAIVNERATRADAAAVRDASGHVRGVRSADYVAETTVRLELLPMAGHGPVAHVEDTVSRNVLSLEGGGDPMPEVTALTRELLEVLVKSTGLEPNHKFPDIGLQAVPALGPALMFSPTGRESLLSVLAKGDALDREARLLSLTMRGDPIAPRARQRLYQSVPRGLVVTGVSGIAAQAGLAVDDVIEAADDEPLVGRFVLDRHLAQGHVTLRVKRGSSEKEVALEVR